MTESMRDQRSDRRSMCWSAMNDSGAHFCWIPGEGVQGTEVRVVETSWYCILEVVKDYRGDNALDTQLANLSQ